MNTNRRKNAIIDLIEDVVLASRVFENIEKITSCCDHGLNSWYPIIYLMGLDTDKCTDSIIEEYSKVFLDYLGKENTNKDTAVLIYNKFENLLGGHLEESPRLKAS